MTEKPWLKEYPEEIPAALTYSSEPLHHFLRKTAEEFPHKTAIHFMGYEMNYRQLFEMTKKLAGYLQSIGLDKGERVAIMLPNCPQAVISFYAVLMAGGIVVQTNPLYKERELKHQLKDCDAKIIITLDLLFPRIMNVKRQTGLRHIIVTAIKDFLPFPANVIYPFIQKKQTGLSISIRHEGNHHLLKNILIEKQKPLTEFDYKTDEDLALIQYTGGTTGSPKGVMLTHKNLIANTVMCEAWLYKCRRGKETVLGILPFFHVYGLTTVLLLSVMQGQKMILLPKFEVKRVLKTIEKQKPTLFPGAPTMYIALLNDPGIHKYDLSSIDSCISGSASLPVEVQEKFEEITGGKLVEGYGLTEASPVTHANFLWDRPYKKGSIGVPWPDTDAAVFSTETGERLPANEIGEIAVRGPQVMKGYWNRPEETAAVLKDGWLLTGDLGYMDEDGYFYVVDRKKDMIIAGGYNIYPREIEEVLYEHPQIREAAVVGIPDPYRGETVKAYVVLKAGGRLERDELDEFLRQRLAAYKVPRYYEFRKELPKTAIGKVLKRVLVEEEKERC